MPKLIAIKVDCNLISERLVVAIAEHYDAPNGMVIVADPITIGPDAQSVLAVPQELCFEYDAQAMQDINGLVTSAVERLDAAQKIMRIALVPAAFDEDDAAPSLRSVH